MNEDERQAREKESRKHMERLVHFWLQQFEAYVTPPGSALDNEQERGFRLARIHDGLKHHSG